MQKGKHKEQRGGDKKGQGGIRTDRKEQQHKNNNKTPRRTPQTEMNRAEMPWGPGRAPKRGADKSGPPGGEIDMGGGSKYLFGCLRFLVLG